MNETVKKNLEYVRSVLTEQRKYNHAAGILNFDQQTICPPKAMEEQGEIAAFLQNEAFKLTKKPEFIEAAEELYAHRDELEEFDAAMAKISSVSPKDIKSRWRVVHSSESFCVSVMPMSA